MPLEGRLVEICGLESKLVPRGILTALEYGELEAIDANGERGRALSWDGPERQYLVLTFNCVMLGVPEANLKELIPLPPEQGGFDLAWPLDLADEEFMPVMAEALSKKGYCVVQMFRSDPDRASARKQAVDMWDWRLPLEQYESAYLGFDNCTKYTVLPEDHPGNIPEDELSECDHMLTNLGLALAPYTPSCCNFESWGRVCSFVRLPIASANEEKLLRPLPQGQYGDHDEHVRGHINFLDRRKLCMMFVVDCNGGDMSLHPLGGESPEPDAADVDSIARIPLEKGRLVVFRHDIMGYTYKPNGDSLLLQAWLMSEPFTPQPQELAVVPQPDQLGGEQVRCQSLAVRYPGDNYDLSSCWSMFAGGTDALVAVPIDRWDMEPHISMERTPGSSYAYHGGFCAYSQVMTFHNEFFGIRDEEAEAMVPTQCVVVESGYEAMERAGVAEELAEKPDCGVFIGTSGSDAAYAQPVPGPYSTAGYSNSIMSSRLSQIMGLKGPSSVTDTEGSSSMVAINMAHRALLKRAAPRLPSFSARSPMGTALVVGINLLLGPQGYIAYCANTMLSRKGRCLTFTKSADGFARGEGCGSAVLKASGKEEDVQSMLACLVASHVNQDGRKASFTAPHGPSQQECVSRALEQSGFHPSSLSAVECHGNSTAMGDLVEVTAIHRVVMARFTPISFQCAKSCIGNLEGGAGMAGLSKAIMTLVSAATSPNLHINVINPHILLERLPFHIADELVDVGASINFMGVSSFSFGGTNGHCDLWGRCQAGPRATTEIDTGNRVEKRNQLYDRVSDHGRPGPQKEDKVYIIGTWNNWSAMHEMTCVSPGEYVGRVTLGDARVEQFHVVVNQNRGQAIHPAWGGAAWDADIEGPDAEGKGKNWVINGRVEKVPVGTVYSVKLEWGFSWDSGEFKRITWEATDLTVPLRKLDYSYRHTYAIVGSWTTWRLRPMERDQGMEGVWSTTTRIGITGREEFHFLRDNDESQAIYPRVAKASRQAIPVMGPDAQGKGNNWLVQGSQGDALNIQLCVLDGEITVTARVVNRPKKVWHNGRADDHSWQEYFLTGSWNRWGFSKMMRDTQADGIFRHRVRLGDEGFHEFQITVEKDWSQKLYPHIEGAGLFEGVLCGPDAGGHGLNWYFEGSPGDLYEIVLDISQEDSHRVVSWSKVDPSA